MVDDRPAWARRMLNERQARGWSQADAIKAMRAHAPVDSRTHVQVELPATSSLLRQYKRWTDRCHGRRAKPLPSCPATLVAWRHSMCDSLREDPKKTIAVPERLPCSS
jgi:hypothetical protein